MNALALALAIIVAPHSQPTVVKVACVGDSITFGEGTSDKATRSYPAQLQKLLGSRFQVRNFGNSGKAATHNHPWSYWKQPEYKAAQEFDPDIVIIALGTNDAIPQFWSKVRDDLVPDLEDMVASFRDRPKHAKVFVAVPPPVYGGDRRQNFEEEVVPLVRQAVRELDVPVIDFHNALSGRADWFPDQLHPNDDGAWTMALEAYFAIGDTKSMKAKWRLLRADSEQADEGPAKNAIDGDPSTYWHTQWSPTTVKHPHELVIDLGNETAISGLRHTPRQDGGVNGRIKAYEVYVSNDPVNWGGPVASGTLPDTLSSSQVTFASTARGRYIRLVAKSEQHGGPWTTIGELDLIPAHD